MKNCIVHYCKTVTAYNRLRTACYNNSIKHRAVSGKYIIIYFDKNISELIPINMTDIEYFNAKESKDALGNFSYKKI
jgi:hypothetical protein